jgi:nucleoside-triphosphatase
MGFRIITLDGKDGILAHVDCNSNYKVGKYRVDLDSFESVAIPTLEKAIKDKAIIVIDEIGKMELFSMKFKELVSNILDGEKTLLCVIKENGDVFTENIKKRGDVTMITVNYENRERLPEKVFEILKRH